MPSDVRAEEAFGMTRLQSQYEYEGKYVAMSCQSSMSRTLETSDEKSIAASPIYPRTEVLGVFDSMDMAAAAAAIDFYKNSMHASRAASAELASLRARQPDPQGYPIVLGMDPESPDDFQFHDAVLHLSPEDLLRQGTGSASMREAVSSVLNWAASNDERCILSDEMNRTLHTLLMDNSTDVEVFLHYTNGVCTARTEDDPPRAPMYNYRSTMSWVEIFESVHDFFADSPSERSEAAESSHHGTKRRASTDGGGRDAGQGTSRRMDTE